MRIGSILARAVDLFGHRPAVVDGPLRLTYSEMAQRSAALARHLAATGIDPGERVAILAPNGAPYLESYFALAGLGAILCPLNVRLSTAELAEILADARPRRLLVDARHAATALALAATDGPLEGVVWLGDGPTPDLPLPAVRHAELLKGPAGPFEPAPGADDAVAQLYYTSGTTGRPKGVMLTHRNVTTHALAAIAELGLSDADTWGHFAPMFHLADAWASFALTWVGGRHVLLDRFEAAEALALIERERITVTNLVPTMLERLVADPSTATRDLSSMRLVLSGGAPIAPALVRRVLDTFGCEYAQTYGMTETSPYLTLSRPKAHLADGPADRVFDVITRTGRAFLTVDLVVADDAGAPVPRDDATVGEIRVRGDTVTPGYWHRPEEDAAAFRDGWLCTGDLATWDAEGYVNIVDRRKDVILSGGETIYCIEVENALYRHPAVREALVYGIPHPLWGEAVHAAVALVDGQAATADELIAHCRALVAPYKAPRSVDFHDALPRTGSGKLHKAALKRMNRSGAEGTPLPPITGGPVP